MRLTATKLFSIILLCSICHVPARADDIAYSGIVATVEKPGETLRFKVAGHRTQETLNARSRILIWQDGIYAQAHDGTLTVLFMTREQNDLQWQNIKNAIEAIRPETSAVTTSKENTDIEFAHELAFRAQLDANPHTSLVTLLKNGVSVISAVDPSWVFDPDATSDQERVIVSLQILADALNTQTIRVASSAKNLYLGFPAASKTDAPTAFWPLISSTPLRLAPSSFKQAYTAQNIGNRLLTAKPTWFAPSPQMSETETVACIPFGGCGYLPKDAVAPIRPIWVTFDRTTHQVTQLVIE